MLAGMALLLDFDGTLVDIAPTPQQVVVPEALRGDLSQLVSMMNGAVAIVSGRSISVLDTLLSPLRLPAAGEHGAELRLLADDPIQRLPVPSLPAAWRNAAEGWTRSMPGVLFEPKGAGFVVHFRLAPAMGPRLRDALDGLLRGTNSHEVLPASCAWEVRPRGIDKGMAVRRLMRAQAFRDRRPLFIGDDTTDEDAIAAAKALGGEGLRVPERFGDAAGVRAWIARLARQ